METIVIQSKHRPPEDDALAKLLGLVQEIEDSNGYTMWFGIENESGDVYRIVGVNGVTDYVRTLKQVRKAGYWVETLESEMPGALHAVVKAKGNIQTRLEKRME
jgi:hypothetical protein